MATMYKSKQKGVYDFCALFSVVSMYILQQTVYYKNVTTDR